MDWRRHAASNTADDGSTRGHGLATTPSASAALIFLQLPSADDDLLFATRCIAGEEHRLPAGVRNEDLLVESLAGSGGELFLSTGGTAAQSAGKLPRFSTNGDGVAATFMALSEWCRTFCGCTFFTGDSIARTHMSAAPSSSSSSSSSRAPPFSSSSVLSANVDVPESTSTGGLGSTTAAAGLTVHPFSNLLINAEAEKSSSGSVQVVTGGGDVDGGGGGSGGGGGGGGGDEAVTTGCSGFLVGTVVSLVCSPLGGTGGGVCLPVAAVADVLTGGVGAPTAANVCSCCCGGRCSAAAVVVAAAAAGDDDDGAAAR